MTDVRDAVPDDPADSRAPAAGSASARPRLGKAPARLRIRADFLRAARGRRTQGRCMTLQAFRRPDGDASGDLPRFGLTVTKKTGGAVERNRIRRRLREALRHPALAPEHRHDYVIVARREALTVAFLDLVAELRKALQGATGRRPRKPGGRGAPVDAS